MNETPGHDSAKKYCAANRRALGRVHLPIAPKALARIRFSPDRPLARALTPDQALNWLEYLESQGEEIKVVNLGGPGDPLATPEETFTTLTLLREKFPGLSICLTSLGFGAAEMAPRLKEFGLAHVSILMDACDSSTAERVYAWIRPGKKTLPLKESTELLVKEQPQAIRALVEQGIEVKVKTTVYPGVNTKCVKAIAKTAARAGALEMRLVPFIPAGDDCPRPVEQATPAEHERLTALAANHLPAVFMDIAACKDEISLDAEAPPAGMTALPKPSKSKPNLAVCSSDGFEVDLHLGQAFQFLIYGPKYGPVLLLEARPAPEPGGGDSRWQQTALILGDCFAVLAAAAGESPKRLLGEKGLTVITQEGNVEGLVDVLYGGGKKKKGGRK